MNNDWIPETHPDWYKDIHPMHYLILGSFPPHPDKHDYPFFYPNTRNRFWKILADLAGQKLKWAKIDDAKAVEERYEIMKKLKTGVQNLGFHIKRRAKSALDTNIEITKFHDIVSILNQHPEIKRILLPGFSAVHSTARSFLKYLQQEGIQFTPVDQFKPEVSFRIYFNDRWIEGVILNSTSTAAKIKYELLLEQFRRNLM
jgi:G:T/U-mismatch repair DNA glycosylase